jgi:hypothetical protein
MVDEFSFLDETLFEPLRSQGELNSKAFKTLAWNDTSPETNWIRVQYAYELMRDNIHGASVFPGAIAAIIRSQAWKGYEFRGKIIGATSFQDFVESKPPQGLGTTIDNLARLCQKYPAVIELIDQAIQNEADRGEVQKRENKDFEKPRAPKATSFQRSLRRLRNLAQNDSKARKLREKVLRGEISANYALKELGKRKSRYGVEASAKSIVQFAKRHLSKNEIKKVVKALEEA